MDQALIPMIQEDLKSKWEGERRERKCCQLLLGEDGFEILLFLNLAWEYKKKLENKFCCNSYGF
jgi:hypothetical protein